MTNFDEKRMFKRYPTHRGAVANIDGNIAYSTVTNIPETGLEFLCAHQVRHSQQIELTLNFDENNFANKFCLIVEIVRCLQNQFEYSVGVIIRSVSQEFEAMLEQLIIHRKKYEMVNYLNQELTFYE